MIEELRDSVVVADQNALEAYAAPEPALQQLGVGRHWRAGDIDERWHDRRNPRSNRGGKWRQVNLVQCPLGHLRRGILTAGGHGAIGAQMLGGGGKAVRRCEIRSLEAAGLRRRHLGRDPGVLPWTSR